MELICIDKQTFEELRVRFCEFEERVTRICRPVKDLPEKLAGQPGGVRCASHQQKDPSGVPGQRLTAFQPYQEQTLLQAGRYTEIVGIELSPFNKEQIMSYHFIDKKDPRIDVMFHGLEKMEKMLSAMEDMPRSLFNGERFLTDEELSKVLRVSRRTLQEYRAFGVIPYYMVQGKALYKESDIMKILDDAYKRCREEQRWV